MFKRLLVIVLTLSLAGICSCGGGGGGEGGTALDDLIDQLTGEEGGFELPNIITNDTDDKQKQNTKTPSIRISGTNKEGELILSEGWQEKEIKVGVSHYEGETVLEYEVEGDGIDVADLGAIKDANYKREYRVIGSVAGDYQVKFTAFASGTDTKIAERDLTIVVEKNYLEDITVLPKELDINSDTGFAEATKELKVDGDSGEGQWSATEVKKDGETYLELGIIDVDGEDSKHLHIKTDTPGDYTIVTSFADSKSGMTASKEHPLKVTEAPAPKASACTKGLTLDNGKCVCKGAWVTVEVKYDDGCVPKLCVPDDTDCTPVVCLTSAFHSYCVEDVEGAEKVKEYFKNKDAEAWICKEDDHKPKLVGDKYKCVLACPDSKPYKYGEKCYSKDDMPDDLCKVVKGQIAVADDAGKKIVCKCPEGQKVNDAGDKCIIKVVWSEEKCLVSLCDKQLYKDGDFNLIYEEQLSVDGVSYLISDNCPLEYYLGGTIVPSGHLFKESSVDVQIQAPIAYDGSLRGNVYDETLTDDPSDNWDSHSGWAFVEWDDDEHKGSYALPFFIKELGVDVTFKGSGPGGMMVSPSSYGSSFLHMNFRVEGLDSFILFDDSMPGAQEACFVESGGMTGIVPDSGSVQECFDSDACFYNGESGGGITVATESNNEECGYHKRLWDPNVCTACPEEDFTEGDHYVHNFAYGASHVRFCDTSITLTAPYQTAIKMTNAAELRADKNCKYYADNAFAAKYGLRIEATKEALSADSGDLYYFDLANLHPTPLLITKCIDGYSYSSEWCEGAEVVKESYMKPEFKSWNKRIPKDVIKLKVPVPLPPYFQPIKASGTVYCGANPDEMSQEGLSCVDLKKANIYDVIEIYPDKKSGFYKFRYNSDKIEFKEDSSVFYYGIRVKASEDEIRKYLENIIKLVDETKIKTKKEDDFDKYYEEFNKLALEPKNEKPLDIDIVRVVPLDISMD